MRSQLSNDILLRCQKINVVSWGLLQNKTSLNLLRRRYGQVLNLSLLHSCFIGQFSRSGGWLCGQKVGQIVIMLNSQHPSVTLTVTRMLCHPSQNFWEKSVSTAPSGTTGGTTTGQHDHGRVATYRRLYCR